MRLNGVQLSDILGMGSLELTRRCCKPIGCHLNWLTREILLHEYYSLSVEERDYLVNFMKLLMRDKVRKSRMLDDLFENGYLIYRYPRINVLARMYADRSPYNIMPVV